MCDRSATSTAGWSQTATRTSVLPRGVSVDASVDEGNLDAEQASALTWLLLAACKELAVRGIRTPSSVAVRVVTNDGDGTTLALEID